MANLNISIDNIGLSVRSSNALHRAGVNTVEEMLQYDEESLLQIRNLGAKSVKEILGRIQEFKTAEEEDGTDEEDGTEIGDSSIVDYLDENKYTIDDLENLSAKAYNILALNGFKKLSDVIFISLKALLQIPRMEYSTAEEIEQKCRAFLNEVYGKAEQFHQKQILLEKQKRLLPLRERALTEPEHDLIKTFAERNDIDVDKLRLSNRAIHRLNGIGVFKVSELIFQTKAQLSVIKNMGIKTLNEIDGFINDYFQQNEEKITAFLSGDTDELWTDSEIENSILKAYISLEFDGINLREVYQKTDIPEDVPEEKIKPVFGKLIAEGILEYVDFRCYRIYPRFLSYLESCEEIDERNKGIILRRLNGDTLETIGSDYGLTRERIRQIVKKAVDKVRNYYYTETRTRLFDEDYYRYFFETYDFDKKDAEVWLGLDRTAYNYLDMMDYKRGSRPLEEAVDDYEHLDVGLRLKVKNYLNRDKLYLDGRWVKKGRAELEKYVIRTYCTDDVSFDEEFIDLYNNVLKELEIPYDEKLYYTEEVIRTRMSHLSNADYLLWKYGGILRYYDIEGQDYTELLDALNFDSYHNIEYSTLKFFRDYPEIMKKYDIRDQYELHNLLRKIIPEGSYDGFHCNRNPMIEFGVCDRKQLILEIMRENAPISFDSLLKLLLDEYGYESGAVNANDYLDPASPYFHNGVYNIDKKDMPAENREKLSAQLTGEFYYIDEIKAIYQSVIPDADVEEINTYTLKKLGFNIFSRYVLKTYQMAETYFRDLLTAEDIEDLKVFRSKYSSINAFWIILSDLKKSREIIEFEPDQYINFRKLEAAGVTKEDLEVFCNDVFEFVERDADENYFNIRYIKDEGFDSALFDLGFSDWFYENIIAFDERFTSTRAFSQMVFSITEDTISRKTFVESIVKKNGSIDAYDLMTELTERYGCQVEMRSDFLPVLKESDVYYDEYLDRLYANEAYYNREVDSVEGM